MGRICRTAAIQVILDDCRDVSSFDELKSWAERLSTQLRRESHPSAWKVKELIHSLIDEAAIIQDQVDFNATGWAHRIVHQVVDEFNV